MGKMVRAFWADERGATAIEYGLIAGLITVAIIGTVAATGGSMMNLFNNATVSTLETQTAILAGN